MREKYWIVTAGRGRAKVRLPLAGTVCQLVEVFPFRGTAAELPAQVHLSRNGAQGLSPTAILLGAAYEYDITGLEGAHLVSPYTTLL